MNIVSLSEFFNGRTMKPPVALESSEIVLVSKGDHGFQVVGFSKTLVCFTLFDGTTDSLQSSPPIVKKHFKDLGAVRTHMSIDLNEACKLFAIILEDYTSKGNAAYDLSIQGRIRSGYGKATVSQVQRRAGTIKEKQTFFKVQPNTDGSDGGGGDGHMNVLGSSLSECVDGDGDSSKQINANDGQSGTGSVSGSMHDVATVATRGIDTQHDEAQHEPESAVVQVAYSIQNIIILFLIVVFVLH